MNDKKLKALKARYHSRQPRNPWPDRILIWVVVASCLLVFAKILSGA